MSEPPRLDAACFRRVDESDDGRFYSFARLVKHIDEPACAALAAHYTNVFPAAGFMRENFIPMFYI